MSSVSVSASVSDTECCIPSTCACADWLTVFCDYVTVTLDYCGVTTTFTKARQSGIKMSAINPQAGVHPSDKVFRLSYEEHAVDVGIGGIITDSDGTEWIIYARDTLRAFCVYKLWARSVSACFGLLESIDVLEQDCECEDADCGTTIRYKRLKVVKGKIVTTTGSLVERNDSRDLVYRFTGNLVRWPLADRPGSRHRLRTRDGIFRIVGVTDDGPFVPYIVDLERDSDDCSVN